MHIYCRTVKTTYSKNMLGQTSKEKDNISIKIITDRPYYSGNSVFKMEQNIKGELSSMCENSLYR